MILLAIISKVEVIVSNGNFKKLELHRQGIYGFIQVFSSSELKALVIVSDQILSCVHPSVCPTFSTSSPDHWATFNQTWLKVSLGEGDSSFCYNEGPSPFSRGDTYI